VGVFARVRCVAATPARFLLAADSLLLTCCMCVMQLNCVLHGTMVCGRGLLCLCCSFCSCVSSCFKAVQHHQATLKDCGSVMRVLCCVTCALLDDQQLWSSTCLLFCMCGLHGVIDKLGAPCKDLCVWLALFVCQVHLFTSNLCSAGCCTLSKPVGDGSCCQHLASCQNMHEWLFGVVVVVCLLLLRGMCWCLYAYIPLAGCRRIVVVARPRKRVSSEFV
jgi:hypothetical protein